MFHSHDLIWLASLSCLFSSLSVDHSCRVLFTSVVVIVCIIRKVLRLITGYFRCSTAKWIGINGSIVVFILEWLNESVIDTFRTHTQTAFVTPPNERSRLASKSNKFQFPFDFRGSSVFFDLSRLGVARQRHINPHILLIDIKPFSFLFQLMRTCARSLISCFHFVVSNDAERCNEHEQPNNDSR